MFIADTHSDTLYNMGCKGRTWADEMITPERLRQGGVTLQTFALWSGRYGINGDYEGIAAGELSAVPMLLEAGMKQVDDPADAKEGELNFMLSLEGCEVFDKDIAQVAVWREKGIRMGALTWNNENSIGTPAKLDQTKGLTAYGLRVVKEMQRLGMAVDTSHLSDAGFYDIYAKTDLPPLASHSCCRALCNHFRNLTDDMLRLMIRNGGYIGINFCPSFLSEDKHASCETIAEHIDHVCQLGGAANVGLGSDFDGIESTPVDFRHPGDTGNMIEALRRRGYKEQDIEGIMGRNLLAYYERIRVS